MMPALEMMHHCAPNVAPETIAAIIQIESGGNAWALGVNGPVKRLARPTNIAEAARQAHYYMGLGYSVDLGLMQINSHNLPGLGLTVEQVLDPCNNLRAGSQILRRGYVGALKRFGTGQAALRAALSAYNTGNYEQGFRNGYVAKYYPAKPWVVQYQVTVPKPSPDPLPESPNIYTADSTVYQLEKPNVALEWIDSEASGPNDKPFF